MIDIVIVGIGIFIAIVVYLYSGSECEDTISLAKLLNERQKNQRKDDAKGLD